MYYLVHPGHFKETFKDSPNIKYVSNRIVTLRLALWFPLASLHIVLDAGYLNFGFWILLVITGLHECCMKQKGRLKRRKVKR